MQKAKQVVLSEFARKNQERPKKKSLNFIPEKPISIVIPVFNQLEFTVQAVESVMKYTQVPFVLIIVDNGSSDGTKGYLEDLQKRYENVKVISNEENNGYVGAFNQALDLVEGDHVVSLNNDVIVSPGWLNNLLLCLNNSQDKLKISCKVGGVGPVSNDASGLQRVNLPVNPQNLEQISIRYHNENPAEWHESGFLTGFCCLYLKEMFDQVGKLDERFNPGGYEDNDFWIRAREKGYTSVVDASTFVFHYGGKTFLQEPKLRRGLSNLEPYMEKWRDIRVEEKPTLFAVYRVKNGGEIFRRSLESTSKFVDGIAVFNDHSEDDTKKIAESFEKVEVVHDSNYPDFNERRDRNQAIDLARRFNPTWILTIDADEIFEDKMNRDRVEELMRPKRPEVRAYGFQFYTFWRGEELWRADGIFGRMWNFRMFKDLPEMRITQGTKQGLHCGNTPYVPPLHRVMSGIRIKHYGYTTPAECERKFEFYEDLDKDKRPDLIGAENYAHLIDETNMRLMPWREKNGISLCMVVKDEEARLPRILEKFVDVVDEMIVVVDSTTTDGTREVAKLFGAKVFERDLDDSLSQMRNFAKEQATQEWILHLDPDEMIDEKFIPIIRRLVDLGTFGYMFAIRNHQPQGGFSVSEAVRLFRNLPELYYTMRVHETLDDSLRKRKFKPPIIRGPFPIDHFGYLKPPGFVQSKLDLYEKLNRMDMKDNPRDARPYYNLGMQFINDGQRELGEEYLEKAAELDPLFMQPRKDLVLSHVLKAKGRAAEIVQGMKNEHMMKDWANGVIEHLSQIAGEDIKAGRALEDEILGRIPEAS
jgi:GT2 family glycosyltransferase